MLDRTAPQRFHARSAEDLAVELRTLPPDAVGPFLHQMSDDQLRGIAAMEPEGERITAAELEGMTDAQLEAMAMTGARL